MALNFPSAPADGDVYDNWVYSSSKGAWLAKPLEPTTAVTSDTAPPNPIDGDMWFNTLDGTTYVWFDDGDTSQWVEMVAPITANGYYSPNYIINGGFDIWQRGTSFATGALAYTADRWQTARGAQVAGMTTSRQAVSDSINLPNIRFCARVQRDSGNTSTNVLVISQHLETADSIPLAGKTVTLSFYARAGSNYSASSGALKTLLISGTGVDQNALSGFFTNQANVIDQMASLTSTWRRYSFTAQVPGNITQLSIQFQSTPSGTAGANDWFDITGVQLEEGTFATPFRRNANSIQGELAACQRYYWRWTSPGGEYGLIAGFQITTTSAEFAIRPPVTMRSVPTLNFAFMAVSDHIVYRQGITSMVYSGSGTSGDDDVVHVRVAWSLAVGAARQTAVLCSDNNLGIVEFNSEL